MDWSIYIVQTWSLLRFDLPYCTLISRYIALICRYCALICRFCSLICRFLVLLGAGTLGVTSPLLSRSLIKTFNIRFTEKA